MFSGHFIDSFTRKRGIFCAENSVSRLLYDTETLFQPYFSTSLQCFVDYFDGENCALGF